MNLQQEQAQQLFQWAKSKGLRFRVYAKEYSRTVYVTLYTPEPFKVRFSDHAPRECSDEAMARARFCDAHVYPGKSSVQEVIQSLSGSLQ